MLDGPLSLDVQASSELNANHASFAGEADAGAMT
jgi:hypothetical protein